LTESDWTKRKAKKEKREKEFIHRSIVKL